MKDDCITQILIASLIHGSIKGWEKKVFELGSESLKTGGGGGGGGRREGEGREGGRGEGDRAFQIPTNRPLTGQFVPYTGDDGDRLLVERFRLVGTLFLCDPGKQEEVTSHMTYYITGQSVERRCKKRRNTEPDKLFARYTKDSMTSKY